MSIFSEPITLVLRKKITLRLLARYKLTIVLVTIQILLPDSLRKYNSDYICLVYTYFLLLNTFIVVRDIVVSTKTFNKIDIIYFLAITIIVYLILIKNLAYRA